MPEITLTLDSGTARRLLPSVISDYGSNAESLHRALEEMWADAHHGSPRAAGEAEKIESLRCELTRAETVLAQLSWLDRDAMPQSVEVTEQDHWLREVIGGGLHHALDEISDYAHGSMPSLERALEQIEAARTEGMA